MKKNPVKNWPLFIVRWIIMIPFWPIAFIGQILTWITDGMAWALNPILEIGWRLDNISRGYNVSPWKWFWQKEEMLKRRDEWWTEHTSPHDAD